MASWKFTGENPLLFTPSFLQQLHDYKTLTDTKGVASVSIEQKKIEIQRSLGMLPREEQSPQAAAGSRMEKYLRNELYPNATDRSHVFDEYMPPIRAREGVYITGKPDVVELLGKGRVGNVHDLKTTYRPNGVDAAEFVRGQGPKSIWGRINSYTEKFQNMYATAFGRPQIEYRGFGYMSPNDPASGYVGKTFQKGDAPSLKQISAWSEEGVSTLENLGPQYIRALEKKSSNQWQDQVVEPIKKWNDRGISSLGMRSTTESERNLFYGTIAKNKETIGLAAEQDAERRAEGEILKTYVKGQASSNSGFSVENEGKGVRAITQSEASSSRGRGVGEGDPEGIGFSPRNHATSKYLAARSRGNIEEANRWYPLMGKEARWSDYFEVATSEYERAQEEKFASRRDNKAFSHKMSGDYEGAAVISATSSLDELNAALLKISESSRAAAEAERSRDKALGTMASVQPYDWTKWYKARNEAWGNIQGASSWLPNFITGPAARFGDAAMQSYGAKVARTKGPYDAFMQGMMPIGAALGALIPGVGPMIGAAAGGSAAALSQIIGNIGEGKIRSTGLDISSKLNMWGGVADVASSAIGISIKALLIPLDLFTKALKIAVPSVLGLGFAAASAMNKGFGLMNNLGNPLTALTGGSTYADFQKSQLMDTMSGMSSGSTSSSVQKLASMRQGFFGLGRFDMNQMLSASMLGQFNMFYNNDAGEGYEDYNKSVTQLSRQFYGKSAAEQSRSMYYLQDVDPTMATHVQTLLNKYKVDKSTEMDWGKYNDPSTYNIKYRTLSDPEREKFRVENFSYQAMRSSIDIDKIRIASALWNKFGEGILGWIQGLYQTIGSGASLKEIFTYIGTGFKDLWSQVIQPTFSEGLKKFVDLLHRGIDEFTKLAPSFASALKPAFLHIADMAFSIFWDIGESIWDAVRKLLYNLSTIQIKPEGVIKALAGEVSWAEAITIVPSATEIVKRDIPNIASDPRNPNRFYDKTSSSGVYYKVDPNDRTKYLMGRINDPMGKMEVVDTPGATAITAWGNQIPQNRYSQRQWDKIQDIISNVKRRSVLDSLSPVKSLEVLSTYLDQQGFQDLGKSVHNFVVEGGYDPLRLLREGLGAGSKEEGLKKFHSGLESSMNMVDTGALAAGLGNVLHSTTTMILKVVNGDGEVLLEKALKTLGEGSSQVLEGAIDALGDLGQKFERLSNLQINRSEQRMLNAKAAGALR